MKNILLLVHDDVGQEARLQTALDLVRALDGHLRCAGVLIVPPIIDDAYSGGVAEAMLFADERAREEKNRAGLEERLAREDISWDWVEGTGPVEACIVEAAILADLVVLNRKLDHFPAPDMANIASRILMQARRPVVAVPDTLARFEPGRALIAWDGEGSAAETMRACVPLLALADAVQIVMMREKGDVADPAEAAAYLSRHGIKAAVEIVEGDGRKADALICEVAATWGADYILMGAYGRGRLAETFGGVTRRMLANCKWPLILAH